MDLKKKKMYACPGQNVPEYIRRVKKTESLVNILGHIENILCSY